MRHLVAIALLLCGLSAPAHAEESREAQLRRWIKLSQPGPTSRQWSLYGQLAASGERQAESLGGLANAMVGGEFSLDTRRCQRLVIGGVIGGFRDNDSAGINAEQWASGCLIGPFPMGAIRLGHHLELDLRPSYASAPTLRARRYNRETISFHLTELEFPMSETSRFQFARLAADWTFDWQSDASEQLNSLVWDVELAMLSVIKPRERVDDDRVIDVFWFNAKMAFGELDAQAMTLAPLYLRSVALGTDRLLLDVHAGFAFAFIDVPYAEKPDPVSEPLRRVNTVAALASLRLDLPSFAAGLRYDRGINPTIASELVRDDRVSAWATFQHGDAAYTLRGFAAHSSVFTVDGAGDSSDVTGGAAAEIDYALADNLRLGFVTEMARTYYADLSDNGVPVARRAARAVVTLTAHVGSSPANTPSAAESPSPAVSGLIPAQR